ncbi:MAG: hypothetical protein PHQ60_08165 [Sideroxydans sp.]|nr:hypothetical protein [Sideroxydans sp.]
MIALEMEASIINHRINVASDLLPASASHAKVIVMYEEANVATDAKPDILALARAAQASFPKLDNLELQREIQVMRGEWERKL